jgi:hypothetical protein
MSPATYCLSCPWVSTQSCALQHLTGSIRDQARLSLGQLAGLKGMYHPHPLPPCVDGDGQVHFASETSRTSSNPSLGRPGMMTHWEDALLERGALA